MDLCVVCEGRRAGECESVFAWAVCSSVCGAWLCACMCAKPAVAVAACGAWLCACVCCLLPPAPRSEQ